MLLNLEIENIAVIEKASINFESGLNILTGETGAGKSIIIDAINAALGQRASRQIVRNGAQQARVSAFFTDIGENVVKTLEELGIASEPDNTLMINRTIGADGRSSCRINGAAVTASMLKAVGGELITICGQHDGQRLLNSDSHLEYIDLLCGCAEELEQYRLVYQKARQAKRRHSSLVRQAEDRQSRLDFLSYQIGELEAAQIRPGEKDELTVLRKKASNTEKTAEQLFSVLSLLSNGESGGGVLSSLYSIGELLDCLGEYDDGFSQYSRAAHEACYSLDELEKIVSRELDFLSEQEIDLDSVESRLDVIYRMSKKYGESEQQMLDCLESMKAERETLLNLDDELESLTEQLEDIYDELALAAQRLSDKRKGFAAEFEKAVMKELSYLDMPSAVFKVEFTSGSATLNGIDRVQFLISANPGQPPAPLAKIASGGELSRIMLAIRCVISSKEQVQSLIFDEIDSGVSGRAATKIALKLLQVSKGRQVICVTHLAQIAAAAGLHLLIEKKLTESSSETAVTPLSGDERQREIARIIGGESVTPTTLQSAGELIDFYRST